MTGLAWGLRDFAKRFYTSRVVPIEQIKELRKQTGAPLSEIKKALEEEETFESAIEWLRRRGVELASKKKDRSADDGLVAALFSKDGKSVAAVEVNCESDFVAKTKEFQNLTTHLCRAVLSVTPNGYSPGKICRLSPEEIEKLKNRTLPDQSKEISGEDTIFQTVATLGEKITLSNAFYLSVGDVGVISSYVHNKLNDSLGKIVSLVSLCWSKDTKPKPGVEDIIKDAGKELCMHITASNPQYIRRGDIPDDVLEKERGILVEQAMSTGKPDHAIHKMVDGRLRKFFEEVVLMDQSFIRDQQLSKPRNVARYIEELSEERADLEKLWFIWDGFCACQ
ncbi:Elongation factor Ts, mitochondrial [Galdieria sulphuraria]|nr:Elongation factor Ts, mitochondrial [Galdieria sulphuraria]